MSWETLSVVRSLTKNAQCTYQELLMNKPLLKIREKEFKWLSCQSGKKPKPLSPHSLSHLSCHPGYQGTISLSVHHKE